MFAVIAASTSVFALIIETEAGRAVLPTVTVDGNVTAALGTVAALGERPPMWWQAR